MVAAVKLRGDYRAEDLRAEACKVEDANQCRRLLALAAVLDGKSRGEAARIGGMDRQTLRDWVHRFNQAGVEGLCNRLAPGPEKRLTDEQEAELSALVLAGPDPAADGVVRWRLIDLKAIILQRYGVDYNEHHISKILKRLGFSHISARPRHPEQDAAKLEDFKKTSQAGSSRIWSA